MTEAAAAKTTTTTTTTTAPNDMGNNKNGGDYGYDDVVDATGRDPSSSSSSSPPEEEEEEEEEETTTKLGKICCGGCCCDYRRASIIMCIIYLIVVGIQGLALELISIISAIQQQNFSINYGKIWLSFIPIFDIMLGGILGILGAKRYKLCYTYTSVIWLCARLLQSIIIVLISIIYFNFLLSVFINYSGVVILVGFTIYPQIGFIREVKLGIMNSETYETREKYDCCCGGGG